jgi:LPS sulfotransferase NodH
VLEGIETGYEEKFDFPYREALPERVYILASVPRSGSTYLSHLLWRSGCLGAPLEYFNFLPTGHYAAAAGSAEKQIAIWRSVLHRRTSPNGVFGVKCFPGMVEHLARGNPALFREVTATLLTANPNLKAVQLKRRDRIAHAISYARAARSGIWRAEQEEKWKPATVPYSQAAVDEALQVLGRDEAAWDSLYANSGITPLVLWYEDVVERPDEAVQRAAEYLGVTLDPSATVSVPEIRRQSREDAERWAEEHAHSHGS